MKDFFKKISDKVNVSEPAAHAVGNIVRAASQALPESRNVQAHHHSSSAQESRLLIGFFKVTTAQWAPYYIEEREYQAHAMLNGMNRPRRLRPDQHHTMTHPFMFGTSVFLLDAYVENQLNELKRISQEYRSGAAKFDFSTGAPRIATAAPVVEARQQPVAAPVAQAPVVQAAPVQYAPQPAPAAIPEQVITTPLAVAPQPETPFIAVTAPEPTSETIVEAPVVIAAPAPSIALVAPALTVVEAEEPFHPEAYVEPENYAVPVEIQAYVAPEPAYTAPEQSYAAPAEPVYAAAETVYVAPEYTKPATFMAVTPTVTTSLAALMPELTAQHAAPMAEAPLKTVQRDYVDVADSANDEAFHELHHMASASGNVIQYAQQAK